MFKLKSYKELLHSRYNRLIKPFKSEDIREKLDMIFNSSDSKIDWSNIPVHIVVK